MNRLQILTGDCRDILPTLTAESVQCCVTSPPYWGLRDYGTAQWEGGEAGCDHKQPFGKVGVASTLRSDGRDHTGPYNGEKALSTPFPYREVCGKCGARRIDSQLGLESTPEEYIANMVAVFRAVWRVLRDDGTLWLNMGDSYASTTVGNTNGQGNSSLCADFRPGRDPEKCDRRRDRYSNEMAAMVFRKQLPPGLKPKDLCMMPARLAMALQADGWYLRSEIVWHKPNPMPESVTDRPTKAHEMIYLLAKQERYFYDAEAIREPELDPGASAKQIEYQKRHKVDRGSKGDLVCHSNGWDGDRNSYKGGRNKRTVWTIATQPYAEAHFATFPEDLIKPCILAGSRVDDTVLDPFAGSGTVGKVALELGRRATLIELNPAYIELAEDRTFVTPGFL